MSYHRRIAAAVGIAVAASACSPTGNADTTDVAAVRAAIDAANATWAGLTSRGHADSIAELYADDAVLYPPNMGIVRGKEGIRQFFAQMNSMSASLGLKADTVFVHGPQAVEVGHWHFAWAPNAQRPPGAPAVDSGKYMARWVSQGGTWKMAQNIWNSDLAMQPPAPAPASPRSR